MSEYIEREAAICGIMPIYKSASLRNRNVFSTARKCLEAVEDTPAADVVEVVHAKWIDVGADMTCSVCGFGCDDPYYLGEANYCPNCGAKMDGGVNDGT